VFAGRRHAQGHPEAGSALYRNLILPEMGRFRALAAYRKRRLTVPTVSLMGGADPGVRPGNATSTAAKRTTSPATSSMARHITWR
jgi:hypothetical protein